MDHTQLTAETIKLKIREEVPSRETGLPGEILRLGKIRQDLIEELTANLKESEADRAARLDVIHDLSEKLKESEADRLARLDVIHSLSERLNESEADRAARLDVIHALEREIAKINERLQEEMQRADACEQGWRALEGTFAVRQARRLRLIRTMGYATQDQQTTGD
jgi:chromosome segregation ATPase